MLNDVAKLTEAPTPVAEADIHGVQEAGFSDRAISQNTRTGKEVLQ